MKTHIAAFTVFSLALVGCNSGSMTVRSYDSTTGKSEVRNYSKYYDTGAWLVPGKIGVSVVVEHEKKNILMLYSIQQSLGALGPSDLEAAGKVTVYVWNKLDEKQGI